MVYKATVKHDNKHSEYLGLTENTFKQRFTTHLSSFRRIQARNETCLSEKIWELKENGTDFEVNWEIVMKAPSYNNISKKCQLCLTEKTLIMYADSNTSINKRNEVMGKCRHKNKWYLNKVPTSRQRSKNTNVTAVPSGQTDVASRALADHCGKTDAASKVPAVSSGQNYGATNVPDVPSGQADGVSTVPVVSGDQTDGPSKAPIALSGKNDGASKVPAVQPSAVSSGNAGDSSKDYVQSDDVLIVTNHQHDDAPKVSTPQPDEVIYIPPDSSLRPRRQVRKPLRYRK